MQSYKMLVLTDHSGHSSENAIYALGKVMRQHTFCAEMDIASRGNPQNAPFFTEYNSAELYAVPLDENFAFHPDGSAYQSGLKRVNITDYDVVWLRMPPPLSDTFLHFLATAFQNVLFINDPKGIHETGSKEFLLNFPELCPPMKVCTSIEEITELKSKFPIVLKPFREYGGKGVVKIDGERVWVGKQEMDYSDFVDSIRETDIQYLGVKYLKNVAQGDKRLVVVRGEIMGASLRLPPPDSWICNVAMGGSSTFAEADKEEKAIVKRITPLLSKLGIIMYGVDTLVDDNGKRILSEINTTSIGGLPQIAAQTGKPLMEKAADIMWKYIAEQITQ